MCVRVKKVDVFLKACVNVPVVDVCKYTCSSTPISLVPRRQGERGAPGLHCLRMRVISRNSVSLLCISA